jgi:hypothetical protein
LQLWLLLLYLITRNFIVRQRLNWDSHVKSLIREGLFLKMYQMSPSSFNKLLTILLLWVNEKQSSIASYGMQHGVREIILHCILCFLAGSSIHAIHVFAGLSHRSFYIVLVFMKPDTQQFIMALMLLIPTKGYPSSFQ